MRAGAVCVSVTPALVVDTGQPQGLTGQPAQLKGRAVGSAEDLASVTEVESDRKTPDIRLWLGHLLTQASIPLLLSVHTRIFSKNEVKVRGIRNKPNPQNLQPTTKHLTCREEEYADSWRRQKWRHVVRPKGPGTESRYQP